MRIYSTTKESSLLKLNTFKYRISNYQISLLYIVAATIRFNMNTPFPSLLLLPSLFPNIQYSSSGTTHQYNNPK